MIDARKNSEWTVYVHIVPKVISGYDYDKYYVGITKQSVQRRWGKDGHGYRWCKQYFFRNAIKKYGWNNIEHHVIATHLTSKEAKDFEKALIQQLDSYGVHGYNLTDGGDGTCGATPKNVHKTYVFDMDNNLVGEYLSRAECSRLLGIPTNRIVVALKNHTTVNDLFFAEETLTIEENGIRKLSDINIFHHQDLVFQFDLMGIYLNKYASVVEASRELNIPWDTIFYGLNNVGPAKGYLWRKNTDVYWNGQTFEIKDKGYSAEYIYQFDKDGSFIDIYPTPTIAAKRTGIKTNSIHKSLSCHGKFSVPTTQQYFWARKNDIQIENGIPKIILYEWVNPQKGKPHTKFYKKVFQFDSMGVCVGVYDSVQAAAKESGLSSSTISHHAIKHYSTIKAKYTWRFSEDVQELPDGSFLMLR